MTTAVRPRAVATTGASPAPAIRASMGTHMSTNRKPTCVAKKNEK